MALNDIFGGNRSSLGEMLSALATQGNEQRSRAALNTSEILQRSGEQRLQAELLRTQLAAQAQEAMRARAAQGGAQMANQVLQALLQRGQQKAEAERQAAELGLRERLAGEAQAGETARSTERNATEIEVAKLRGGGKEKTFSAEDVASVASQMGVTPAEAARTLYGFTPKTDKEASSQLEVDVGGLFADFDQQQTPINKPELVREQWQLRQFFGQRVGVALNMALAKGDTKLADEIRESAQVRGIPIPEPEAAPPEQATPAFPDVRTLFSSPIPTVSPGLMDRFRAQPQPTSQPSTMPAIQVPFAPPSTETEEEKARRMWGNQLPRIR